MSGHRSALADLIRSAYGHAQAIYVHLPLVEVVGGWPAAIVFSHLAFWYERYQRPIYKSARELGEDLHMSERSAERAVAHLRSLGVLSATVKKASGAPTNHYSIDYGRMADLLAKTDSANLAESDSANLAESITEGTYRKDSKPSSTSVDARAEKKEASASTTPSPREVPASASPKGSPPSSAAPPLNELRELAEVWNQHRGRLREFRSLAGRRVTNLKRLVRQCAEAGADPKLVVRLAAQELSKDEHYLAGKYDLENAIQSGRIAKFIDDALAPQPGEGLVAGQLYVWPRDPSRPWAGNLMGAFTGELVEVRGRTFAIMEIDGVTHRAPVDSLEPKK